MCTSDFCCTVSYYCTVSLLLVVTVGFNQVQYEVEEGKTIEVCIVIFEPQEVDVDVDLDISTVPSNVSGSILLLGMLDTPLHMVHIA